MHGDEDGADEAAGEGLRIEGGLDDQDDGRGQLCDIQNNQNDGEDKVEDSHEGDDDLRDFADPLQAADDDEEDEEGQDQGGDDDDNRIGADAGNGHGMGRLGIEEVLDRRNDAVDLAEGADAEETDAGAEEGEEHGQPLKVFPHAPFYVVERAAQGVAVSIYNAVLDGKQALGVLRCHADAGGDDHPEEGAGTAGNDGRRNADDISGADGCGEGRTEGLEARHFPVVIAFVVEDVVQGQLEAAELKTAEAEGEQGAARQDQDHERDAPDKGVDVV